MRRHWEETAICISCTHYDYILIIWNTFIVQCTHAYAALLPKPGSFSGRGTCLARLGREPGCVVSIMRQYASETSGAKCSASALRAACRNDLAGGRPNCSLDLASAVEVLESEGHRSRGKCFSGPEERHVRKIPTIVLNTQPPSRTSPTGAGWRVRRPRRSPLGGLRLTCARALRATLSQHLRPPARQGLEHPELQCGSCSDERHAPSAAAGVAKVVF